MSLTRPFLSRALAAILMALAGGPLAPGTARAAEADVSRDELLEARAKFEKALALQTAGDWAGALRLLKQVAQVRSTPHVRFNIALCEENLGQLVAALGDYELAAADAREADAPEVAESAYERLELLRARIPKLIVERGEGAENAELVVDGVTLGEAVIGKPMPMDPGPHVVQATSRNRLDFKRSVSLKEGESETVVVTLEPDPDATPSTPPSRVRPDRGGGSNTTAYVVGGIGIASLAASGVLFYLRQSVKDEIDAACDGTSCPEDRRGDLEPKIDQGNTYTLAGNITLGVGIAGVAASVVLLLADGTSSSASDSADDVRFHPAAPDSVVGASFVGRF